MAVSKRLRYEVLRRDNHACRYCGAAAPDVKLTVDHVIPTALGGSDEPSNLVTACDPCNKGKSASSADSALVADVDARAVRWAQAMQVAIERRAAELAKDRTKAAAFEAEWLLWTVADKPVPRAANWRNSILRFLAGGLDHAFMTDAIATAMGRTKVAAPEKWRYFCGICWREMDKIRESAAEIADLALGEGDNGQPSDGDDAAPAVDMFPYMELFDVFVDEVVILLGGTRAMRRLLDRALWNGMADAHRAYRAWEPPPGPRDEDEDDGALEAAKTELLTVMAYHLPHVGLLHQSKAVDA